MEGYPGVFSPLGWTTPVASTYTNSRGVQALGSSFQPSCGLIPTALVSFYEGDTRSGQSIKGRVSYEQSTGESPWRGDHRAKTKPGVRGWLSSAGSPCLGYVWSAVPGKCSKLQVRPLKCKTSVGVREQDWIVQGGTEMCRDITIKTCATGKENLPEYLEAQRRTNHRH